MPSSVVFGRPPLGVLVAGLLGCGLGYREVYVASSAFFFCYHVCLAQEGSRKNPTGTNGLSCETGRAQGARRVYWEMCFTADPMRKIVLKMTQIVCLLLAQLILSHHLRGIRPNC